MQGLAVLLIPVLLMFFAMGLDRIEYLLRIGPSAKSPAGDSATAGDRPAVGSLPAQEERALPPGADDFRSSAA